jgi:hypothetical protein
MEPVMLEPLLASTNCERVLIFLAVREEGYLREIADFSQSAQAPILKQLEKLENGGVLFSRLAGRTWLWLQSPLSVPERAEGSARQGPDLLP